MAHRAGRIRFSLATMMLVVVGLSSLLAVWKALTYEQFTHRIPLYEKADGTRKASMIVGPNRVKIGVLARNERDGTIREIIRFPSHLRDAEGPTVEVLGARGPRGHENGRGQAIANGAAKNKQALVDAAPWLDIVQVELAPGPNRLDIIEARIFDHRTRELISRLDPAFGWRVVEPEVVQVYGLGKKLPAKLDVWLRLQSYGAGDAVTTLAKAPGSSSSLPGGSMTLVDIRDGYWGYMSKKGLVPLGTTTPGTTIVIRWNGEWGETDYQIAAVSATGETSHTHGPHLLRPSSLNSQSWPIYFDMPLDEVDHFELRPFGGRHRFFFEAVTLPQVSASAFANPPTVKVDIAGQEKESKLTEFLPLDVRIATHRGRWASGVASRGDGNRSFVTSGPAGATNLDKAFTLTYGVKGAGGNVSPQFRFLDSQTGAFVTGMQLGPRANMTSGSTGYHEYSVPLERVKAIEVTLRPSTR